MNLKAASTKCQPFSSSSDVSKSVVHSSGFIEIGNPMILISRICSKLTPVETFVPICGLDSIS